MARILLLTIFFSALSFIELRAYLDHPAEARQPAAPAAPLAENANGETVSGHANAARNAIRTGDYELADDIIDTVIQGSLADKWDFYPLEDFMQAVAYGNEPDFLPYIDKWVEADHSAFSYLVRAQHYYSNAWSYRGDGPAQDVPKANRAKYNEYVQSAILDATASLKRDANIPYTYLLLLRATKDTGKPLAGKLMFQQGAQKFPYYYALYDERMRQLAPKWGGSVNAMVEFDHRYADDASRLSPLSLLTLGLYASIAGDRQANCALQPPDRQDECQRATDAFLEAYTMGDKIRHALYDHADSFAAHSILMNALGCGCIPQERLKPMLDLAASVFGTDDYSINLLYGQYYSGLHFYPQALYYYGEALKKLQSQSFADSGAQKALMAKTYNAIALTYRERHDNANRMKYGDAAIALDGKYPDYLLNRCQLQFEQQHWPQVIQDCAAAIGLRDTPDARYMRGEAYAAAKKSAEASADFETVLRFPAYNSYKTKVFADLMTFYRQKNNYQGQLDALSLNGFLYSERFYDKGMIADHYAERCRINAYFGQYQKALQDCDSSLSLVNNAAATETKKLILRKQAAAARQP